MADRCKFCGEVLIVTKKPRCHKKQYCKKRCRKNAQYHRTKRQLKRYYEKKAEKKAEEECLGPEDLERDISHIPNNNG